MTAPILELRGLCKTYGPTTAVDHVSVSLAPGEFLSFLGPSGSGKTTTLGLIAGLIEPSAGDILLQGRPLNPLPPHRRNIGVVFQNYALFPHMTVAANVAFPLQMRRVPRSDIRTRVAQVLQLVDLVGLDTRLPAQLSGGQQQRVALARAMVFEPPLLLMDEPLGALDKQLREQMQLEIKRLHRRVGVSVIYVTHDQDEALTMSSRIAVFNRGRIEQIGTPSDLYDRPASRFVAGFVGDTNLLPAAIATMEGEYCTLRGAGFTLLARTTPGLSAGQSVTVAIRPERMRIAAAPGSAQNNTVAGIVAELVYLGRARKYVVHAGPLELTATQPIASGDEPVFAPGDPVHLHWQPHDATRTPRPVATAAGFDRLPRRWYAPCLQTGTEAETNVTPTRRSFMAGSTALAIGPRARAQARTKVLISQALLIANYTPVYLAQQRGLFAKHGLDVDISTAGGIAVVVPVILADRAQFALSGSAPSVNATLEGGPMKCIANIAGGTALLVLGRPGTVVKSLDDFKGKTIATLRFPSNTNTTPKYVFRKLAGFDPAATNTTLMEFPPGAQAQAVKDGRADFAVVFEWDASIGVTQFGLEVVYSFAATVGPNASSTIFATDAYLAGNADTAQRLLNAIAEGMKIIHSEPGAYEAASARAFPQVPEAAIRLGSQRLLDMASVIPRNPIITKRDWDAVMTIELGSGGGLKQALPFEQMVDNRFAEKATAEFGLPS